LDGGLGTVNPVLYGFIGFLLGATVMFTLVRRFKRAKTDLRAELWVLLPTEDVPGQPEIMSRLLTCRDYVRDGKTPISPAEGLVMSDIRLDIDSVLKKRNRTVFQTLPAPYSTAEGFVRLRFISEIPVSDRRHLRFLAYAAEAYLHLGNGIGVYNPDTEETWTKGEFKQILQDAFDGDVFRIWVKTRWAPKSESGEAETRGLRAIGLNELRTPPSPSDHRLLVQQLLEELAMTAWSELALPDRFVTEAYGDQFELLLRPSKGFVEVRMMRMQPE
jgi:hypothetical protein